MQSVKDTIHRRDRTSRRSANFLRDNTFSDGNNNAKKNKDKKTPTPKIEERKIKDENPKKKKGKFFASLPSVKPTLLKIKGIQLPHKVPGYLKKQQKKQPKVVHNVAETFTETIGGEPVTVNQLLLLDEEGEKNIHLLKNAQTPVNYGRTLEYFKSINDARVTFFRAADCAGDLLLRGEVEGDAEVWDQYCHQKKEDVRKWRRDCDERHAKRAKESRQVEEGEGTRCFAVKKFGKRARAWFWEQFVDIFPCCVPE